MFRRISFAVAMIAASTRTSAAQRGSTQTNPPGVRTLLTVDSAQVINVNTSPDGKLIVFSRRSDDPTAVSSIWLATRSNPKPVRITSEGYKDSWPTVSPTGDRIFFVSNRPNRDQHSKAQYAMSIPIDKTTGRPTGPPRQVTTDSIGFVSPFGISPDGKWLAYTVATAVRLVSTAGGNPKTLATRYTPGGLYTTFSADGKSVVFQDSGAKILRKVSVNGGPVATLVRGGADLVVPVAGHDDRYMLANSDTVFVNRNGIDLRDMEGKVVGVSHVQQSAKVARSDGAGWIGVKNLELHGLKRVSLTTGAISNLFAAGPGWPLALTDAGSIVSERTENDHEVLTTFSPNGQKQSEISVGPEVKTIARLVGGGNVVLGLGAAYTHTPILNKENRDIFRQRLPLYLIDRRTGSVRKLADSVLQDYYDNDGIAVVNGTMIDFTSIDGNAAMHLVRSFPAAEFLRWDFGRRQFAQHGMRLAYTDSIAPDKTGLNVTTSPTSARVQLAILSKKSHNDITLGWSQDGRRLAVAYNDASRNDKPTVRIFDVAPDGSLTGTTPPLDLGGSISYYESVTWLPDGSAVFVMVEDDDVKGCVNCIAVRPLDSSHAASRINTGEMSGGIGSFWVEPGGKSILVEIASRGGASIWTADFVPVKKP